VLRGREGLALVRAKGEEPGGGVGRVGGVDGVSASGKKREDAGVGETYPPNNGPPGHKCGLQICPLKRWPTVRTLVLLLSREKKLFPPGGGGPVFGPWPWLDLGPL